MPVETEQQNVTEMLDEPQVQVLVKNGRRVSIERQMPASRITSRGSRIDDKGLFTAPSDSSGEEVAVVVVNLAQPEICGKTTVTLTKAN